MRLIHAIHDFERRLFTGINRHFDKKYLNFFFRFITYLGGALFTITSVLALLLFSSHQMRLIAAASAAALALSHVPVFLLKKVFPRKRPYLVLERTQVPANPLSDHSFPSGHTTAIFSVIIPYAIQMPGLAILLLPVGIGVAVSRIYLGLHYPSDVIAGLLLGTCFGCLCFYYVTSSL